MRADIKQKWISKLLSGDYAQGRSALRIRYHDGKPDQYCCLGVLCELAVEEGVIPTPKEPGLPIESGGIYTNFRYGIPGADTSSESYLPRAVSEWASISGEGWIEARSAALASLNDNGTTFAEIAALVEEHF
jgi:hypothetical protein